MACLCKTQKDYECRACGVTGGPCTCESCQPPQNCAGCGKLCAVDEMSDWGPGKVCTDCEDKATGRNPGGTCRYCGVQPSVSDAGGRPACASCAEFLKHNRTPLSRTGMQRLAAARRVKSSVGVASRARLEDYPRLNPGNRVHYRSSEAQRRRAAREANRGKPGYCLDCGERLDPDGCGRCYAERMESIEAAGFDAAPDSLVVGGRYRVSRRGEIGPRIVKGNPEDRCAWHPDREGPYLALIPGAGGIRPTTVCPECASRLSRGEQPTGTWTPPPIEENPTHRFARDPFARSEMRRDTAGSGQCDNCGQERATLYRYGRESDSGRYGGPAKGKFCSVGCFRSYHDVRPNPSLILVTGNPAPPSEVEAAWMKFHGRDRFAGKLLDMGRIPGAPPYTFALGRCVDIDLGAGVQKFTPRPWLVYSPKDEALWIVAEKPMRLGTGVAGKQVHRITYDPMASSGKDPAFYRHKFSTPRPTLSPVGSPNHTRGVLLDGGRYNVDDWIRD